MDPATPPILADRPPPAPSAAPRAPQRERRTASPTLRVRRDGKFFRLGADKFHVKGVTYGPFAASSEGALLPERDRIRRDFEQIRELGGNCLRIYHVPPDWFLDLAQQMGLKVLVDIPWASNVSVIGVPAMARQTLDTVRAAARACGNHPAVFALSVANEIPPDLVRYHGRRRVERFIDRLVHAARAEAPDCLITFANFPTTEYLQPRSIDFVCFNLYLHDEAVFRKYLSRLQTIAGDQPLLLGEYGIDTAREYGEQQQADILAAHVRAVFDEGCAGTFIFSYTDDWVKNGWRVDDWKFGIVGADRTPKPAFDALRAVFARVPQLADITLPMCSVIICTYNGADTLETCLRSMQRLHYPNYEVIVVDDGSTDNTQEIVRRFPDVRNVLLSRNSGLSHARNVGMEKARGEVLVYTDSDCEADEDWLYYLMLRLGRSGNVCVGGPNLAPDEGSWVAEVVAVAPGGPTHVMIDDHTAEHVPGCNLAVYAWAAREIGGFDPQFRRAGDDVDFIWRLQARGMSVGFAPAAQVWHYRRNTVAAYLQQQRGYGEAEAMLRHKHPDRFNLLGASHWRGTIYVGSRAGVRIGRDVIYHGLFGTGLFQTIYRQPVSVGTSLLMSVEWHLLGILVTVVGLAFWPLLWVAAAMFLAPLGLSIVAAAQAPMPPRRWRSRLLLACLQFRQPMARGWARYSTRLRGRLQRRAARAYDRPGPLPLDPHERRTLRYWHNRESRLKLLHAVIDEMRAAGWRLYLDSGWSEWDLEIHASRYTRVRLVTWSEAHDGRGYLTRVKVKTSMSRFALFMLMATIALAALLLLHLWPWSQPAVLLPLAWWILYLLNRRRVTRPVLALVDHTAAAAGFLPILPKTPANQGESADEHQ